ARQERCCLVAVSHIEGATGHGAQPDVQREDVKESDGGDAHDGAAPSTGLVLDGVVADKDVWQRRRTAEQSQHQRDEIDFVERVAATQTRKTGVSTGEQNLAASRWFLK